MKAPDRDTTLGILLAVGGLFLFRKKKDGGTDTLSETRRSRKQPGAPKPTYSKQQYAVWADQLENEFQDWWYVDQVKVTGILANMRNKGDVDELILAFGKRAITDMHSPLTGRKMTLPEAVKEYIDQGRRESVNKDFRWNQIDFQW